jgi:uncharacterized protein
MLHEHQRELPPMKPANENKPKTRGSKCPICDRPSDPAVQPFCSTRCADVDLHRWLSGRYAIPVVEDDKGLDDEPGDER